MEKLRDVALGISKATNLYQAIVSVLKKIKDVVNCSMGSFFLFKSDLIDEKDRRSISIQKSVVESKFIDNVSLQDIDY